MKEAGTTLQSRAVTKSQQEWQLLLDSQRAPSGRDSLSWLLVDNGGLLDRAVTIQLLESELCTSAY